MTKFVVFFPSHGTQNQAADAVVHASCNFSGTAWRGCHSGRERRSTTTTSSRCEQQCHRPECHPCKKKATCPPIVSHPPTPELPDPPAPAVAPGPWCIRCERPMRPKSSMQCVACRAWFHVGCMRKDAADKCIFFASEMRSYSCVSFLKRLPKASRTTPHE